MLKSMLNHLSSVKAVVLFIPLFLIACSHEETFEYSGVVENQVQTIYSQAEGVLLEIEIPEEENVEAGDLLGNIDDELYKYQTQESRAAAKAIKTEIEQLENNGTDEADLELKGYELEQAQARLDHPFINNLKLKLPLPTMEKSLNGW